MKLDKHKLNTVGTNSVPRAASWCSSNEKKKLDKHKLNTVGTNDAAQVKN